MKRRMFLSAAFGAAAGGSYLRAQSSKARIAITFDLEMSRNFPTWETTHWDYEKGNLDDHAKRYSLQAARLVKARGGVLHFFLVGRVLEQENVDWLKEIIAMGHPIGNHIYDHVYVLATRPQDVQFRFQRAPWLMRGRPPAEVIADNIHITAEAMRERLGIAPNGFRTPGGFVEGLAGRPDVQRMLLEQGYRWCSGKYPRHPTNRPDGEYLADALEQAQPFRYAETDLLEIPMSPVSDINAFRSARWPLARFLEATRYGVEWAIRRRAVYDFLAHPSCLGVVDPKFAAIRLICSLVERHADRAEICGLDAIARAA